MREPTICRSPSGTLFPRTPPLAASPLEVPAFGWDAHDGRGRRDGGTIEPPRGRAMPFSRTYRLTASPPLEVPVFGWGAHGGRGRRACGITDDPERAVRKMCDTLVSMPGPGVAGTVRPARLNPNAEGGPAYVYGPVMVSAWRETADGPVEVRREPSWQTVR